MWLRSYLLYHWIIPLVGFGFLAGCASVPCQIEYKPALLPALPSLEPTPLLLPQPMTLLAGGDVLPASHLEPYLATYGMDYPYTQIAPYFQAADMGLVNLECPLSLRGQGIAKKKFTFCGHPDVAIALKRAGINVVSLANNHILDFGPLALQDTLQVLDQVDISYAGVGTQVAEARTPAVLLGPDYQVVAIFSYSLTYPAYFWATRSTRGTALARMDQVQADIRSATAWADWIVVCFHWGGELQASPRPYQCDFGRAAIDAGAHLVVGTHPHVLQGIEWYGKGLILYSLGNLIFGGGRSVAAQSGALVKVMLQPEGQQIQAWVLPLQTDSPDAPFQPKPLLGHSAQAVLQLLQERSRAWQTRFLQPDSSGWVQVLPPLASSAAAAKAE